MEVADKRKDVEYRFNCATLKCVGVLKLIIRNYKTIKIIIDIECQYYKDQNVDIAEQKG